MAKACTWCTGKGAMGMIDPWTIRKETIAGRTVRAHDFVLDIPCPSCRENEANAWLVEKIERDGAPYTDAGPLFYRWSLYRRERDGRQLALPKPAPAHDA